MTDERGSTISFTDAELDALERRLRWSGDAWTMAGDDEDEPGDTELGKQLKQAADAIAQLRRERVPRIDGYAYRYATELGDVVRFNDGSEVNGSKPIATLPYMFIDAAKVSPMTEPTISIAGQIAAVSVAARGLALGPDGQRAAHTAAATLRKVQAWYALADQMKAKMKPLPQASDD